MEPFVCILVPFTGWSRLVEGCVSGCLGLKYGNFLLCLLPNEGGIVPDHVASDPRVHVIVTSLSGISHKRNLAIKAHPEADFYACTDSDAVPTPDWLRNGIAAFERSADIGLVGGPDVSPEYPGIMKRAVRNALDSWLVAGERAFMKKMSASRYTDDLRSANLIFRREVIQSAGMFDEEMPVNEDSAFCLQGRRQGWKMWFDSDVVVLHHNRPLFLPFLKQRITTGYGVPFLLRKHPEMPFHGWRLRIAPIAMFLYLLLGPLGCLVHPRLFSAWAAGVAVYLITVAATAVRHSARIEEVPLTAAAIAIGNLGPALGILLAIVGMRLEIVSFYRNQEE